MIAGSCTDKLMQAEMLPLSMPYWNTIHPFTIRSSSRLHKCLKLRQLNVITGFAGTLQPNSGAQGEYAGFVTIH
jgi:glycine dehydrogenase